MFSALWKFLIHALSAEKCLLACRPFILPSTSVTQCTHISNISDPDELKRCIVSNFGEVGGDMCEKTGFCFPAADGCACATKLTEDALNFPVTFSCIVRFYCIQSHENSIFIEITEIWNFCHLPYLPTAWIENLYLKTKQLRISPKRDETVQYECNYSKV